MMETEAPPLTRYQQDVLRSAEGNHLWLNAFQCVSPSDEFLMQVGRAVLNMLATDENLIHTDWDDSEFEYLRRQKELVLRVNKS